MHYNIIKTAAGARTRLRLPMVWKADAVAAEKLPEAVFWVFIGGERVRVEKTPGSDDEYIFPELQAGQYAWDLVVDAQVVLHGVLKVRGSAVPPGGGEVCGTLLVDAPAMVLVLSPGPRGEVGPVGPQGLSAYEVALQHGYEGSEDDWAEELSGAQAAATKAKEQATEAGKQAKAAAASATTACEKATAAENAAKAAADSATDAGKQAGDAGNSAKAAADSATDAGKQASAAADSAKAAAGSATTAGKQASAAVDSAKAAADSATTASEQATAAANSAKAADSSATTASEQATAAANSATAAATAADAVKYDLLPMSVDWLHTQFVQEIGDGNFTVRLNEEQKTLNVSFAHDIPEEQCESLLQLCRRVTPQIVGVVRDAVPTDYTELEYLEANGTQYINTGIHPPCVATISFAWLSGSHQWCYWGVELAYANNRGSRWGVVRYNDSDVVFAYAVAYFDKNPLVSGQKNVMIHSLYERTFSFTFNGTTIGHGILSSDNLNPTNAYRLFGGGSERCRLFAATITDADGKTALDLIPVLRNADGVAGMWDKVSKKFLENNGPGRFGYRIKRTGETSSPMSLRDPYYVAPSGVYARRAGENELEVLADTEAVSGVGWEWFAHTSEAYEYFGIVSEEE